MACFMTTSSMAQFFVPLESKRLAKIMSNRLSTVFLFRFETVVPMEFCLSLF
jgi:hypothetical protein